MMEYVYETKEIADNTVGNDVKALMPLSPHREEIIRCRDCKFLSYERTYSDGDKGYNCTEHEFWLLVGPDKEPDGFCSWAVRK